MSEQNTAFEEFVKSLGYSTDKYKYRESDSYSHDKVDFAWLIWNAATAEANKRIEALQLEVNYLKSGIAEELEQRILELQANNHDLREALEKVKAQNDKYGKDGHIDHVVVNALYSTPAESLQAHDNEVIEKCAVRGRLAQLESKVVDIEIRALK